MRDSQLHSILTSFNSIGKKKAKKNLTEDVSVASVSFSHDVNDDGALVANNQTTMRNLLNSINENLDDNQRKVNQMPGDHTMANATKDGNHPAHEFLVGGEEGGQKWEYKCPNGHTQPYEGPGAPEFMVRPCPECGLKASSQKVATVNEYDINDDVPGYEEDQPSQEELDTMKDERDAYGDYKYDEKRDRELDEDIPGSDHHSEDYDEDWHENALDAKEYQDDPWALGTGDTDNDSNGYNDSYWDLDSDVADEERLQDVRDRVQRNKNNNTQERDKTNYAYNPDQQDELADNEISREKSAVRDLGMHEDIGEPQIDPDDAYDDYDEDLGYRTGRKKWDDEDLAQQRDEDDMYEDAIGEKSSQHKSGLGRKQSFDEIVRSMEESDQDREKALENELHTEITQATLDKNDAGKYNLAEQ